MSFPLTSRMFIPASFVENTVLPLASRTAAVHDGSEAGAGVGVTWILKPAIWRSAVPLPRKQSVRGWENAAGANAAEATHRKSSRIEPILLTRSLPLFLHWNLHAALVGAGA